MKVTVNFGAVRVIVPCGRGEIPVRQLMDLAITRYKKATGKSLDSWVTIHNLKLLSDGGILDPDDKLSDVADDREQIIAVYEEEHSSYLMHNGGDGTSASSIGTESPDIFQNGDKIPSLSKASYNGSDVEIMTEKITTGILPLHVRRGSEPALNRLSPSLLPNNDSCKRWSAAVLANDESYKCLNSEGEEQSEDDLPPGEREDGSGEEKSLSYQHCNGNWNGKVKRSKDKRKEPLGGPLISDNEDSDCSTSSKKKVIEIMKLKNENGPLGISIIPADDSPEKNNGVIIQGIEPGGRIDRDGRFRVGDRITEINGLKLSKDSYRNAQEILKDAMKAPELSIHLIRKDPRQLKKTSKRVSSPPPILPKHLLSMHKKESDSSDGMTEDEKGLIAKCIYSTPSKKSVLLKGGVSHSSIRKVGRRVLIHLTKGNEGLGFSITSKDPNNGPPFFIKNILPAGAAVDDGRLKTGDKLNEVNKTDVSHMTQAEVLNLLRKVPYGEVVELIITRQETDLSPSPSLPRELPPDKAGDEVGIFPWKRREVLTFEVPLNDTGSAGLGVSVKGKTSNTANGAIDMGIFLKNIFHGGAAFKDGRLRMNDQLLNVNGISLLGMTNGQAMETLRRAMIQGEGPTVSENAIILTVARRVPPPVLDNPSDQGESSSHDRSDSLLSESGDSFYVSNENLTISNKCNQTPDTSTSDHSANTVIFMSPSHKKTDSDISEENEEDLLHFQPVKSPIPDNGETVESITNEIARYEDYRASPRHWNGTDRPKDLLNLNEQTLSAYQDNKVIANHTKSFSSPLNMEYSDEQQNIAKFNGYHSPSPSKMLNNKCTFEERRFRRNGFGRQSMPEKRFFQSPQKIERYTEDIVEHETANHISRNSPYQTHSPIFNRPHREMPVDVGPCESYVKLPLRKPHCTKGDPATSRNSCTNSTNYFPEHNGVETLAKRSCNSPDCPYHAVPTGRESGSSQGTCTQVVPSATMFKSASLESLQTALQNQQRNEDMMLAISKDVATRGCNESFRAAVDKSFEARDGIEIIQNNVNKGEENTQVSRNHTRAKTVDPSLLAKLAKKSEKPSKKKGLFKGLGSVFRFGKSSKKDNRDNSKKEDKELEQLQARKAAQEEQERIQQRYLELVEQQKQMQLQQNRHLSSRPSFTFPRASNQLIMPTQNGPVPPQNHQDRMQILRAEHQRKHQQRNRYYPQEDQEEFYEQKLQQIVDKKALVNRPLPPLPNQQVPLESAQPATTFDLSPKSKSLEIYKEMSKPGSRKGFADPNCYSHYMNFQEIQQQLQQFQLHQSLFQNSGNSIQPHVPYFVNNESQNTVVALRRHYRHTVSSPRSRPVSEFLDLENAKASKSYLRNLPNSGSLPRRAFGNNRQRLPIPTAFMMHAKENGNVLNGHACDYNNQTVMHGFNSANYKRNDATSSKV